MNHALIDVSIILIGEIQFDLNDNSQHLLESQFNTFNVVCWRISSDLAAQQKQAFG